MNDPATHTLIQKIRTMDFTQEDALGKLMQEGIIGEWATERALQIINLKAALHLLPSKAPLDKNLHIVVTQAITTLAGDLQAGIIRRLETRLA